MSEPALRVGIDAGPVSTSSGGTKTYVVQLLGELTRLHEDWSFHLYHRPPRAPELTELAKRPNVTLVESDARPNVRRIQVELPARLARDGIEVFHSPGYFLPLRWNGPMVVTIHDLNMYRGAPRWMRRGTVLGWLDLAIATPLSSWRAHEVIADSEATKADVTRFLRVSRERVHVIPLAPDPFFDAEPSPDEVRRGVSRIGDRPYVLFAGILSPQKNLTTLVAAFARSGLWREGVRLVLAGSDREGYGQALRLAAEGHGVGASVVMPGYLEREVLRVLYRRAECLVLPSHGEGFGLPLVEAMACGTAVLAANRQSLPEVLGGAGLLFEPDDPGGLADSLARVHRDSFLRVRLGQAALERRRAFSWTQTAEQTAEVYQRAGRARVR